MNETKTPGSHLITYVIRGIGRPAEGVEWFDDIDTADRRYAHLIGRAEYVKVRMEYVPR